ncbi:MAG: hypothetical protein UT64_C0003G0034 [Candidatus Falkowbacteria bacterium GW2011_GWF2_39_8]|uniref:Uncharacterized protein n=1 Tax=Candidatus Falkowbacteria bacterium GW2011_GWF2_39_8 TaxID=1618642 RepID=A0A0G0Q103_9BACT|nr:MAG: hypothetical protein UT64_C0003G0034 [Candidatus Falkowbacteria bacterium GW2011_GWF2_39_8]
MLKKLKRPVHSHLAWLAISAVYLPSFFLVNFALAQSQFEQASSSTDPLVQQSAPVQNQPSFSNEQIPPMPPYNQEQPSTSTMPSGMEQRPQFPASNDRPPKSPDQQGQPTCPIGMVCSGNRFNQEYKIDDNRFKEMKRGMQGFANMIKMVEAQTKRLKSKNIAVPEELAAALTQANELREKIKSAKTPEELEGLGDEIQGAVNTIQEWMPKLPMLAEFPRIVKQAEREMAKLNKSYNTDIKKIKIKKIDLAKELAEFKNLIDNQQKVLDEIKALSKTDPEESINRMQLDDVWMKEKIIQIAMNYGKSVSLLNTEIKNAEKIIIKLKAQKNDTSELETNLADIKNQFKEVKTIYSTKPLDSDQLVEAIGDIMDSVQELRNQIQELKGETDFGPSFQVPVKDVVVPKGFLFN